MKVADLTTRAGALIDGALLRVMERTMSRRAPERPPRQAAPWLDELAAIYGAPEHFASPDTFFVPPPQPDVIATHRGELTGGVVVDLRFRSAHVPRVPEYRPEWNAHEANQLVHARWYRSTRPRPVAVLFHGWGGGSFALEALAFPVDYFRKLGLDVVLFTLPFHGLRSPRGTRSGELFPSPHVLRTNEAFAQAVSDFRALREWLLDHDVPGLGVAGMSLGGYTTALVATLVPDLKFAIPIIPAVSMSELMWRHGSKSPARQRAVEAGITQRHLDEVFRVHAPLARAPMVAKERRFIIAARGDRITPPDQAESLWRHWERPPIHWFPGGHLAQVGRGDAFRAMGRFLRTIL